MEFDYLSWVAILSLPLFYYHWTRGKLGNQYDVEVVDNKLLITCHGLFKSKRIEHEIDMTRVVKLQKTKDSLSFFYQSGHAIDVWHQGKTIETFWQKVSAYFPNAELVLIDN